MIRIIRYGLVISFLSTLNYACREDFTAQTSLEANPAPDLFAVNGRVASLQANEAQAYSVRLSAKSHQGAVVIPNQFQLTIPDKGSYLVKITEQSQGYGGVQVYKGRLLDYSTRHFDEYTNALLFTDPAYPNTLLAAFIIDGKTYELITQSTTDSYHLAEVKSAPGLQTDAVALQTNGEHGSASSLPPDKTKSARTAVADETCNGVYMVDVCSIISTNAAKQIGANNLAIRLNYMVENANISLANSRVSTVRLRLVAMYPTATDHQVGGSSLSQLDSLYARQFKESAADLLVGVFKAGDQAGLAYIPGHTSVIAYDYLAAWAHEVGHNAGSGHCAGDFGIEEYAHGYDNGQVGSRTRMCGNDLPMYSNPVLTDAHGSPLGDAQTANNTRLWSEQASRLATFAVHQAPYALCSKARVNTPRFYVDCNYVGFSNLITKPGNYDIGYLIKLGLGNDQPSSLELPAGYRVTLFENAGYQGEARVFTGPARISCLVDYDFNDKTSSLTIEKL